MNLKKWGQQGVLLLLTLGWVFVSLTAVSRLPGPSYRFPGLFPFFLLALVGLPLSFYAAILWHEMGHLLAGGLVGFRFILFTVGPLRVAREVAGWRLGLIDTNLAQFQGRAYSVPTRFDNLSRRKIIFLLGGPLGTLLQLLLLTAVWLSLRHQIIPFWQAQLLQWLLYTGLMMLPFTLLPVRLPGFETDAGQAIYLWRNGGATQGTLALSELRSWLVRGMPPAQLDDALLATLRACAPQTPERLEGLFLSYWQATDREDEGKTAVYLAQLLEEMPTEGRNERLPAYAVELATAAARQGELAKAKRWLAQTSVTRYEALSVVAVQRQWRAEAFLLLAEGKLAEAKAAAQVSLAHLAHTVDLGSATVERKLLDEVLQKTADVTPTLPVEEMPFNSRRALVGSLAQFSLLLFVALLAGLALRTGSDWVAGQPLFWEATDYVEAGYAHLERAEYESAVADFEVAVAQEPHWALAHRALGEAHYLQNGYEAAVVSYTQAITLDPEGDPWIYMLRATALAEDGRFAEAAADYERLAELETADDELQQLAQLHLEIVQDYLPTETNE